MKARQLRPSAYPRPQVKVRVTKQYIPRMHVNAHVILLGKPNTFVLFSAPSADPSQHLRLYCSSLRLLAPWPRIDAKCSSTSFNPISRSAKSPARMCDPQLPAATFVLDLCHRRLIVLMVSAKHLETYVNSLHWFTCVEEAAG